MSKQQHHPGRTVLFLILFVLLLLAIATGPVGFVVLVIVGVPVAIFAAFDVMAHGASK